MERKNDSEVFLQKIFERSEDPIAQLERINSIVPVFFINKKNAASVNKRLDSYGYKINDDYLSQIRAQMQMFSHPSCGIDSDYGITHPSCGIGGGYGITHPSCGIGIGGGHPSCCSSKNEKGKSLLLIRKNNSNRHNEIRN